MFSVSSYELCTYIPVNPHVWNVHSGEKDLRNRLIQLREQIIPQRNQPPLTNSSKSLLVEWLASVSSPLLFSWLYALTHLLLMQSLPSFLEIHPSQPHTDSTRRYQDDTMSLAPEFHYSLNDRWKKSKVGYKRVCWWYNRGSTWVETYQSSTHMHVSTDLPSLMTIVRGVDFDLAYKAESQQKHDRFETSRPAYSRTCW